MFEPPTIGFPQGLDRLPRAVSAVLEDCARVVMGAATALQPAAGGAAAALGELEDYRLQTAELMQAAIRDVGKSRRQGPDRGATLAAITSAVHLVGLVQELAWRAADASVAELAPVVSASRDVARAVAGAVDGLASGDAVDRVELCVARERELRLHRRAARAWLFGNQPDPLLALSGAGVLDAASELLREARNARMQLARLLLR